MSVLNEFESALVKLRNGKRARQESLKGFTTVHHRVLKCVSIPSSPQDRDTEDHESLHRRVEVFLGDKVCEDLSCEVLCDISEKFHSV